MSTTLITTMLQELDARQGDIKTLNSYHCGEQTLAFLAPEARTAIGSRFGRMTINYPRLAVNALTERLRVTGFMRAGKTDPALWKIWLDNDLDQRAKLVHREALILGRSYVIVWANADGSPNISVESAEQVLVQRDPGTRNVIRGIKRWETKNTTEVMIYEPDKITHYRADQTGTSIGTAFTTVEVIKNPLGWVPIIEFQNTDRLLTPGASELTDLIPLVDGLNKIYADMMVGSEFYARPRRWASGVELEESPELDKDGEPTGEMVATNPYPEGNRMMIAEAPEAKFGQLPASDLASYKAAVEVLISAIMAVTGLPAHYTGVLSSQPPSADSLRASEAALTAKAEDRQSAFGRSWEQVMRLAIAVQDGTNPDDANVSVQWGDPATRSIAQEADAITKLYSAGLLPASYALKRLGYADHEIEAIRVARRSEALDQTGTDLTELLS